MKNNIADYVTKLSPEAKQDMAAGQWDEIMTDALYAACGAETVEDMAAAREIAQTEAAK